VYKSALVVDGLVEVGGVNGCNELRSGGYEK
jgi:hypothetical protein